MAQKVLNEQQLREYVEGEVRRALMNEMQLDESLFSWEGLIGGILGRIAIKPLLDKILDSIGIPHDGRAGQLIVNLISTTGGAALGSWVDNKFNPLGK